MKLDWSDDVHSELYFECHITVEPVFGERLERLKELSKKYDFKVANLLMKKEADGDETPSVNDCFTSARDTWLYSMKRRMGNLLEALTKEGFQIWRYKIEDTILDSKRHDQYGFIPDPARTNQVINLK